MPNFIQDAHAAQNLEMERMLKHLEDTPKDVALCRVGAWLGTTGLKHMNDFWDESL